MAKERRETYLKDPVGSKSILNEMPSGLIHTADSLGNSREGRIILRFGSPGDPLGGSTVESAGFAGRTPNLQTKFMKGSQR